MTSYAEARAAQLAWLLPCLRAEHDRLMSLRESTLTGAALHDSGIQLLRQRAAGIARDIKRLETIA